MEYEELINSLIENAFNIISNNSHREDSKMNPIAFGIYDKGLYVFEMLWDSQESKINSLNKIGQKCFELQCYKIFLFVDSAMRKLNKKEDIEYFLNNKETEAPLCYPESQRIDALLVSFLDLTDEKQNFIRAYPYKVLDGKIKREEVEKLDGNYEGLVKDSIIYGFLQNAVNYEIKLRELSSLTQQVSKEILDTIRNTYPGVISQLI